MGRKDTRRQLILAAERLFAERGIEGVSLREINLAAGQRNTSAAHYHFGSKEALVDAIFEFRRPAIGTRRDEWFGKVERDGRLEDPRALTEAFIMPLAQEMRGGDDGASHYLMFLAHLFLQSPDQVRDILRKHQAGEERWSVLLTQALPEIPPELLFTRIYLLGRHVVISLAVYQRRGLGLDDVGFDIYLSNLIDSSTGYLTVAPSERTMAQVENRRRARRSSEAPSAN
ncbi:MAG: TetR/AcrR family transcriptional regulator [Myxococcales bacterium]